MIPSAARKRHERWLLEVTALPTAAGREDRVITWVKKWAGERSGLALRTDAVGNLIIEQRRWLKAQSRSSRTASRSATPNVGGVLWITAHLDHPAFVVTSANDGRMIELEFRGGVNDPYFEGARIEIIDSKGKSHHGFTERLDPAAKPFKRITLRLDQSTTTVKPGDIGRWMFEGGQKSEIHEGLLHAPACDDLAAVAAALAALDVAKDEPDLAHVGVLLTRAEEIGFIGAIGACKKKSVAKGTRLLCLENSRSFTESPIGAGPIVRVGDKMSVFDPRLTNAVSAVAAEMQKRRPEFRYQRKLMPGGTCEATTFSTYGYSSTCLCLALGNYHNMTSIDDVAAGKRPAKIGREFISVSDYHGLIELLVFCAGALDSLETPSLKSRMERLWEEHRNVL